MSRRRRKTSSARVEAGAVQPPISWSSAAKAAWHDEGDGLSAEEWIALKHAVTAREREAQERFAPLRGYKDLRDQRRMAHARGLSLNDYVARCIALEDALVRSPALGMMLIADRVAAELGVPAGAFEPFAARLFADAARAIASTSALV
jgi:hypothetical protein